MLLWSYLLRLNLVICWLFVLVALPKDAVASDYQDAIASMGIESTQYLLTTEAKAKVKNNPVDLFETFDANRQKVAEDGIVLSPHPLPPDVLEAIFPTYREENASTEGQEDHNTANADNFVLSPHPLPSEELDAIFSAPQDVGVSIESNNETVSDNVVLSPYPLSPDELEAIFPNSAEYASAIGEESEERLSEDSEEITKEQENLDFLDYAVPPYAMRLEDLSASGTRFRLNRQLLNHLSTIELQTGYQFSNDINSNSSVQGTLSLDSRLQRSIANDQVVTVEHRGAYLQAETVTRSREVTVTRTLPQTINGFGIQLSFTGACLFPETTTQERCTYTPGLSTVEYSNILDFREAGKLQDDGELGAVLTDESLAAIKQPGFQRGEEGQTIGIDLLFPNTGTRSGNRFSDRVTADRRETYKTVPVFTLARSRQIVQMNDKEAALAITLRGNTWISQDSQIEANALLQAGIVLLPDIVPRITGNEKPANPRVNSNIFLAVNNARLPQGGFTLYHGGISRADSVELDLQPKDLPSAKFRGVWIGLSPVVDYRIGTTANSQSIGSLRSIKTIGAEGNGGSSNNLNFVSLIGEDEFIANNIHDTYVQIYQSLYETDAQTVMVENYEELTAYYPHISFTGNTTAFDNVFNYYAGLIFEEQFNAYAGADYTAFLPNGLTYELGGIVYTQPDRDYYSQLNGKVTKRLRLSENASLALSGGLNWALDRDDQIGDIEISSRSSAVYLKAKADLGRLSLQATGNVGGILPESARNSLRLQTGLKLADSITLSSFVTAFSKSSSYARYGASLAWQLVGRSSPVLSVGWTNNRYSFGTDLLGNALSSSEDSFVVSFKL